MRKYTSPSEKVAKYSLKYKLPEGRVKEIIKSPDSELTIEELRIKYDNKDVGKIPDWISEEELTKMISKAVSEQYKRYKIYFEHWIEPQDLFNELYIYVLCKNNLLTNYKLLKTGLNNYCKYIAQYRINRFKYLAGSIDKPVTNNSTNNVEDNTPSFVSTIQSNNIPTFSQHIDEENSVENMELVSIINSVKDKQIKAILIVTGYLVANIVSLRPLYLKLLKETDKGICNRLIKLQKRVEPDNIEQRTRNITIKDVLNILSVDEQGVTNKMTLSEKREYNLNTLRKYLVELNIF